LLLFLFVEVRIFFPLRRGRGRPPPPPPFLWGGGLRLLGGGGGGGGVKRRRRICLHGVDVYYMQFFLEKRNPVQIMHKGGYLVVYKTGNVLTHNATLTEARSCSCSGKATCIACTEFVFVALGIQHAMRMHRIVICSLSGCTIFFHFIS